MSVLEPAELITSPGPLTLPTSLNIPFATTLCVTRLVAEENRAAPLDDTREGILLGVSRLFDEDAADFSPS